VNVVFVINPDVRHGGESHIVLRFIDTIHKAIHKDVYRHTKCYPQYGNNGLPPFGSQMNLSNLTID